MTTDREELLALLSTVERFAGFAPLAAGQALRRAADRARRHLLHTEAPDGDCAARIDAASTASYAAGAAHGVDARPNMPQGFTVDP
jgi:hypothetical protein